MAIICGDLTSGTQVVLLLRLHVQVFAASIGGHSQRGWAPRGPAVILGHQYSTHTRAHTDVIINLLSSQWITAYNWTVQLSLRIEGWKLLSHSSARAHSYVTKILYSNIPVYPHNIELEMENLNIAFNLYSAILTVKMWLSLNFFTFITCCSLELNQSCTL